jgi:uncharacterized membrane protein (Fun14 family)
MEEQEKKVTQYLIPANVTTRFEFFEGFGWSELKIVVIACLIGTAIFWLLGLPKKVIQVEKSATTLTDITQSIKPEYVDKKVPLIPSLARSFAIIIPGGGAFMVVKRNPTSGMSLITTLKSQKAFKQKQKLYIYKYNSGSEG